METATGKPERRAVPEVPTLAGELRAAFDAFDATQAVAVDDAHFYAVNSYRITKHDKATGAPLLQWDGLTGDGPVIHLDSGVVHAGRLYAAHSNWPAWPMTSSIEVWDTATMAHVATYSFGIQRGSFTWLDRYDGSWWGAFANYNRVQRGQPVAYGLTRNTQVVRMDDAFQVQEAWTYPGALLDLFEPMSNSGASWGPDGRLYVTGHDAPAVYVVERPAAGSLLQWVATIAAPGLAGQGIAWERRAGAEPVLWGIQRRERKVCQWALPPLARAAPSPVGVVRGPGQFVGPR